MITNKKAYFVGGGIAALAGATLLIRDGQMRGEDIHVLEELTVMGGSLDGKEEQKDTYVIRGGRMFNDETYECTWDLLSSIPSLNLPEQTVREEFAAFNEIFKTHAKARLVDQDARIVDVSTMGFQNEHRLELVKLINTSEEHLGVKKITDWFSPSFFTTNFWYMWSTMFAFQPWHSAVEFKRYLLRFMHEFHRINTLEGVRRSPYNQYDSVVKPIVAWLKEQGVHYEKGKKVTSLDFKSLPQNKTVERIHYEQNGLAGEIALDPEDLIFVTLGSMTESSTLGSMHEAPPLIPDHGGAWDLWKALAKQDRSFGNPSAFADHVNESKWESFTVTCHDPIFFDLMEKFSGNEAGEGALVTFKDSNWLMSVVLAHQPHFLGQPEGIQVFWGYSLLPDAIGNYVPKRMSECTGEEILTELCHHLKFEADMDRIIQTSNCIPCMMPYITSQFMPRAIGDRPQVIPEGSTNLAFLGQFTEMPDDVVFTVEYSIRSAQTAVYTLLGLDKKVTPINKYQHQPKVLFEGLITSFK